jgi:hypothetical protein
MALSKQGFLAVDLEESVAAPGCGDCLDGATLSLIGVTIDASITVAVIYYDPPQVPQWPPQMD